MKMLFTLFGTFFLCSVAEHCIQISANKYVSSVVYIGLFSSVFMTCFNNVILTLYFRITRKWKK